MQQRKNREIDQGYTLAPAPAACAPHAPVAGKNVIASLGDISCVFRK